MAARAQATATSAVSPHTSRDARSEAEVTGGDFPRIVLAGGLDVEDALLFFRRVQLESFTGCWRWTAGINNSGYGIFNGQLAHRTAFQWFNGPIPDGLEIDHLCRNKWCVSPRHLEPVTPAENCRRARLCTEGHLVVGDNVKTERLPNGRIRRRCAICHRTATQRGREKRHASA